MLEPSRKGTNSPFTAGVHSKSPPRQFQLLHHQRMQQPGQIRARRHAHARKRFLDRARAAHARAAFEHQHALPGPRQIRGAGQAVVPRPDDDRVPGLRREFANRRRQTDLAEHECCRGIHPGYGIIARFDAPQSLSNSAPIFTVAERAGNARYYVHVNHHLPGTRCLYSRQQIAERVAEMGAQITHDLNGEKLVMVGVLKGAAFFLVDLSRAIQADATFDFVAISSYGNGQRSSGAVKLIKDLDQPIEGKNVLIVEDILDTGLTLSYLRKLFLQQHPKSLRIATLLDKPSRRIEKIDADYVGFSIPNLFVIGYGMDYAERYRNLPDICLMAPGHPE